MKKKNSLDPVIRIEFGKKYEEEFILFYTHIQ
jgi:hypothetical protein